ncbi:MAG: ATP-binding protein [Verrucomicrobiota bacterium]
MSKDDNTPPDDNDNTKQPGKHTGDVPRASWKFSADTIQQGMSHCTPLKKEAMVWAFTWCIDRGIWFEDFCKQVGYDKNTIYKIYTGRHRNPQGRKEQYDIPDKLYRAVLAFRKLEVKKAKLGETEFVETPTARRIFKGCDIARDSRTPVWLYGASHLGKTWALRQYTIENNHGRTLYARVPSKAGLKGLVAAIASAVGVSAKADTPKMVERIKKALAANHLLIIDELHQLLYTYRKQSCFACIEVIREIYDEVECGMMLSTTNVFRKQFEDAQKEELEQLFRRGVHKIQLGDIVLTKDLKPILAKSGLPWPKRSDRVEIAGVTDQPYEVLRNLSREGGLKAITERIRYARLIADTAKKKLDWSHFIHAHIIIKKEEEEPEDDWS